MHGPKGQFRRKASDYAMQLREKQRARRIYGVLEKQFRRYFNDALRRPGMTGVVLLQTLERRLDNVVFRLGLADSRSQARQLVTHGHFAVNGRATNIPSFLVKPGDRIAVQERSRQVTYFQGIAETVKERPVPAWLRRDQDGFAGEVLSIPARDQMDVTLNEQLIVEYYSR